MNYMDLITKIFEIVVFPLLGIGTIYLITLIKTKIQEIKQKKNDDLYNKYLTMLEDAIVNCVLSTTQTYVESLKKAGKFDADAQKAAFQKTYDNVMRILSEDAKEFLQEALGDLNTYVLNKIEAEVKATKEV